MPENSARKYKVTLREVWDRTITVTATGHNEAHQEALRQIRIQRADGTPQLDTGDAFTYMATTERFIDKVEE